MDVTFLSTLSPHLAPVVSLFSNRNQLDNFGRGPYEEHLCDIILNFSQKVMS